MKRSLVLVGLGLVTLLSMPRYSFAVNPGVHYFDCKQCHKAALSVTSMHTANVCLSCHENAATFIDGSPASAPGYNGNPDDGRFSPLDSSDVFGSTTAQIPVGTKTGRSHAWGVSDAKPQAGAAAPNKTLYAGFYGRYNISTGKVTCSRCHDPHGEADLGTGNPLANPKLLIRDANNANQPMDPEKLCRACHVDFDKPIGTPFNTHPMVANYGAVQAAKTSQYKTAAEVAAAPGASKAQLINGGVGCTSCHRTHFVDSNSTTADGAANRLGLMIDPAQNPGELLRGDGPLRTGVTRNGANGTAQLRSNLCQTCHTYKMHGKGQSGDVQIGCLECHNAHDYSSSSPYGIRNGNSVTTLPTRVDTVNQTPSTVNFGVYPGGAFTRSKWADNVEGTATGYCERCHGDVEDMGTNGIGLIEIEHQVGAINPCTACHKHNDPASLHSFNIDANAATCGQCHGFPPYLNTPGDRDTGGIDGGYARNEVDGAPYDYAGRSYFKNEAQTAHKTHAGAALPTNPGTWYFVGTAGIENCMPCHGNNAGTNGGGHRIAPGTDADTFRNVNFNQFGTGDGHFSPTYNPTTAKCSATYCHSNGGPRTGDSTRDYTTTVDTPAWVGNGTTDGFNSIQGKAARCGYCHGYTEATMGAAQKKNSQAHLIHLNKGYGCEVCHIDTALNSTTLEPNATDGRAGGEHINLIADVSYKTSGTPLSVAMATNVVGPTYNTTTGTCSIYCHDPQDVGASADWDNATDMQCDSCHKGLLTDTTADGGLGPITSGSHLRHVSDATGPKLGCDECHGPGSSTGSHSGMLDGTVVVVAGVCNTCHAVDAGETVPVWGVPATGGCVACHTGATTTPAGLFTTLAAPALPNFLSTGHGKPNGTYAVTGKTAANKGCLDCHGTSSATHYDNIQGNDTVLQAGFNCSNCHNGTAATLVLTHSNQQNGFGGHALKNPGVSPFTKVCVACHNPHGSSNATMIHATQASQNSRDPDGSDPAKQFRGNVVFSAFTGADSFDEDDANANADDICATCHTLTDHNRYNAQVTAHNEGQNCLTCHGHNGANGGFMPTAAAACNGCHGNPPATGAHAKHTTVTTNDLTEDRTDCANCHTGADSYTYGAGGNHMNSVVNVAVGYSNNGTPADKTDDTCATACHPSTAGDGKWGDANGLNCDSCHYYAASPVAGNNLSDVHDEHFAKGKLCSACHNMAGADYNNGSSVIGPLQHINNKSGANEGAKFTGMVQALQDEAGFDEGGGVRDVVRSGMTYTDANTCSGGIGLGCHATGTPDWDIPIPNDGTSCTQCHTDTSTASVNPTSSLHAVTPTVSGKKHSTGFTYNGGASTADCTTCHTTSPSTAHQNGTLNATIGAGGNTVINFAAGVGYTDAVTPTCAVSTTGCHSRGNGWSYKWHTNAAQTNGTQCDGCHGMWSAWNTGVINHRSGSEAETVHGTGAIYKCKDCHGLESGSGYPFANTTNDWKPTEAGTTLHGDGLININTAGTTGYSRGTYGGCTGCHSASDGTAAGQHAFAISTWTLNTITSDAITSSCSSCHGGATVGVNQSNYWPDGTNTINDHGTADNQGEHAVHIQQLALQVYGETITGAADNDILKNNTTLNPALTSDQKQKELCSYCHNTPGADGDHGVTYPADVNSMYTLWSKALDNGALTPATGSCATVDCHNNVTTTAGYYWYAGGASACAMCHTAGASDATHVAHTSAGMGITINCLSCHGAGTTTTTAPSAGHINGTLAVAGSVSFTYTGGMTGTCGTNFCHNDGKNGTPRASSYAWGTPIAACDACHGDTTASLTTQSHAVHTGSTIQSMTCASCHAAATVASHIDGNVTFGGTVSYTYTGDVAVTGSTFGGCGTNNCHNNGKNAAPRTSAYTWGTAIPTTCGECHGDTAATLTTEAHAAHLNAAGTYGKTIVCTDCHTSETNLTNHVNATINITGMTYGGDVAITGSTFGSCGTNACHENGFGAAPVTASYNWNTTLAGCSFCHNSAAMTSGSHTTHVGTANAWGPYPAGSTNCGECHQANANNTSMAGMISHINGTNDFTGTTTLAATTVCNTCHGGATPAGSAKSNWAAATRVTCESCHGQYSAAVVGGKTAPSNAGASYTTYGHNKVTNNPTYGGRACADCHNISAVGHFDGVTGDDKRMKVVNGQTYAAANNSFCANACHGGTAENAHYANTNTAGGTSDDGIYCMTCHNPHGQNGNQDAMVRSTIAGRAVAGFTDKAQRSSYANASFNGVCQVCHDGAEVSYFNRTTFLSSHQGGVDVCTSCHSHSGTTGFSASGGGCNSCHGYPPVQRLTGAGAAYTYAKVEDYPGGGRAHAVLAHINPVGLDPSDGWTPCAPCHDINDHRMGYGVGNMATTRDSSGLWNNLDPDTGRKPTVRVNPGYNRGGTATYNMGTRNTAAGMGNCSSTLCHFSESPKWDCLPADTTNDPQ